MDERKKVVSNLRSAIIHLAICCYSEDKAIQAVVQEIAQSISDAIDYLEKGELK